MKRERDPKNIIMLITVIILLVLIGVLLVVYFFGDNLKNIKRGEKPTVTETPSSTLEPTVTEEPGPSPYTINKEGKNIEERFPVPAGYVRLSVDEGSFAAYLRKHSLKNYGSPSYTYESQVNEKADLAGVFNQDISARGLQQYAHALMRLWAEYLFEIGDFNRISFDFYTTPIFKCDFETWAEGSRLQIEGNDVSWVKVVDEPNYSYENFRRYLDMVMAYANSITLQLQLKQVNASDLSIGDVFIMTAGQLKSDTSLAAIVVDMAINKETNETIFLVAQGGSPSTETYVVLSADPMLGAWHKLNSNNEYVSGDWTCPATYFRRFG